MQRGCVLCWCEVGQPAGWWEQQQTELRLFAISSWLMPATRLAGFWTTNTPSILATAHHQVLLVSLAAAWNCCVD
jgi:hypothetical protein